MIQQESRKLSIAESGDYHALVSLLMSDSSEATDYPAESMQQCLTSFRACVSLDQEQEDQIALEQEKQFLNSLVIRCAEAVAVNDNDKAESFIRFLRWRVSPTGTGAERLAHYFTETLAARLTGKKTILPPDQYSIDKFYKAYRVAAEVFPVIGLSVFFTNQTILNHTRSAPRIHIVDYGIAHGFRWLCLLKDLSERPGGPPQLRITGVDSPHHHMSIPAQHIGAKLLAYAKKCGVPFQFHSVVSTDWDLVSPSELGVRDACTENDEALIITGIYRLRHVKYDPCVDESARKRLLRRLASMKPAVFIQAEFPLSGNVESLEMRVREGLEFYSGVFGAIEEIVPEESKAERGLMEWVHGMDIMNMVAFEGEERVERPECYKQWQIVVQEAGFRPVKLQQNVLCKAVEMVRSYKGNFSVDRSSNWLLIRWRHHLLSAITAWSPK